MDYLGQFVIPIHGLKIGTHSFTFQIGDEFFESFSFSEIRKGKVQVVVTMEKRERMIEFSFRISGELIVECDRCSGVFPQHIEGNKNLIVKLGQEHSEESDEIVIIPENEHKFDISSYIYEFMILLLPYRRIHPPDENGNSTCDQEVIKKLEQYMKRQSDDTRWDALKSIDFDNDKDLK